MPILVICSGCKAQFNVHEKFAGKQGPCPKCKALISIPKAASPPASGGTSGSSPAATTGTPSPSKPAAAAPPPEVKIHAPDDAPQAGKTATGRASLTPLLRTDARMTPRRLMAIGGVFAAMFLAAWLGGTWVRSPPPPPDLGEDVPSAVAQWLALSPIYGLRALGLLLIGWPIALAGYAVLRDDELEPYRGPDLRRRMLICLAVYVGVWGVYSFLPDDLLQEPILLGVLVPLLLLPAAVAAYFCFDLDYLGSAIHACFFFLVTLLLGATAGLDMPWSIPAEQVVAPSDTDQKPEVIYQ